MPLRYFRLQSTLRNTTLEEHMLDLIIKPGWIFTGIANQGLLTNHVILIKDGKIVDLVPESSSKDLPAQKVEELPTCMVLPGLVNGHSHASMSLLRCVGSDLSTLDWLKKVIWPVEGQLMEPKFVADGARLGATEMLLNGITTAQDMYFFPEEAAMSMAEEGMRVVAGGMIIGFPSPQASNEEEYFTQAKSLFEKYKDHPNISFNMAPHAPYSVSKEMLQRSMAFAEEHGCQWQIHLSETPQEVQESLDKHGLTPVEYLHSIGCLNSHTVAVHCVCLTDKDIELLARSKASVIHCPTSNLKLGCGIARVPEMLDAGINVGIGTDGCASGHNTDVLEEMRLAGLLAKGKYQDPKVLPVTKLLEMGTKNSAKAIGLGSTIGVLETGKSADLIAVDTCHYGSQPCLEPLATVLYCAGAPSIIKTYVSGKTVAEKQLSSVNLPNWRATVSKCNLMSWQNKVCEILQSY